VADEGFPTSAGSRSGGSSEATGSASGRSPGECDSMVGCPSGGDDWSAGSCPTSTGSPSGCSTGD
jgi:hypothetical protein